MTDDTQEPQFQIDPSSIAGQLIVLARYVLTSGGSFALGKGWIDGDALQFITGIITIAAPAAYAIWKTYSDKQRLVTIARAAPDDVAKVAPA